mmetsp:Transcript_30959/g.70868  ORF Transcript_30959/g.70868 Transcript_30959/m.70868 type:complete len:418 (+) Transcript_30959:89-1342(+)
MQGMLPLLFVNLIFMTGVGRCVGVPEARACPNPPLRGEVAAAQSSSLVQANTKRLSSRPMLEDEEMALSSTLPASHVLDTGLAVVRVPKTGSTTLQAIVETLGRKYNGSILRKERNTDVDELFSTAQGPRLVYTGHGQLSHMQPYLDSVAPDALKISMVREPAERCMSSYYHLLVGYQPYTKFGDDAKLAWIEGRCEFFSAYGSFNKCLKLKCPNFMFEYLQPFEGASLKELMASFTMIGVTERFDESMVIMSKKLGVPMADMIYVTVKEAGGDVACGTKKRAASQEHLPLDEEPYSVRAAAQKLRKSKDMFFYDIVNAALDKSIAEYDGDFSADLSLFRSWLEIAEERCKCLEPLEDDESEFARSFACIDELVNNRGWKAAPHYTFSTWMATHNATAQNATVVLHNTSELNGLTGL